MAWAARAFKIYTSDFIGALGYILVPAASIKGLKCPLPLQRHLVADEPDILFLSAEKVGRSPKMDLVTLAVLLFIDVAKELEKPENVHYL
jgi:hypothetical protein